MIIERCFFRTRMEEKDYECETDGTYKQADKRI